MIQMMIVRECKVIFKLNVKIYTYLSTLFIIRIAGAIQIPNKVWPAIVLLFFVILAPGSSFILNLSSACFAILCK
jgi:hypothetical protein